MQAIKRQAVLPGDDLREVVDVAIKGVRITQSWEIYPKKGLSKLYRVFDCVVLTGPNKGYKYTLREKDFVNLHVENVTE